MSLSDLVLVLTVLATGLMAGLFYAWSVSVMPGFARLSNKEFVAAMQAANRAIQNPLFFSAFFGAPILLLISTFFQYGEPWRFRLLLAASIFYLVGNFGVTVFGNVPLNNTLDRFNLDSALDEEIAIQRAGFERRWNILNNIRTVSSIIAFILVAIAVLN